MVDNSDNMVHSDGKSCWCYVNHDPDYKCKCPYHSSED